MAGKWAKLLKGNPKYEPAPFSSMSDAHDKSFVEKVGEYKSEYAPMTQAQLQQEFHEVNEAWEEYDAHMKVCNARLEALGQLLIALYDAQGVTSVKTDQGETLYQSVEPSVTILDKEALYAYVDADPELQYFWGIHPQTLATFVKGLIEAGLDSQIPECLKIWTKTSIRSRKATS